MYKENSNLNDNKNMIICDLSVEILWKMQSSKLLDFVVRSRDKRITKENSHTLKKVFVLYDRILQCYETKVNVQNEMAHFDQ